MAALFIITQKKKQSLSYDYGTKNPQNKKQTLRFLLKEYYSAIIQIELITDTLNRNEFEIRNANEISQNSA